MSCLMWKIDFHCHYCKTSSLRTKGVYNHVRLVLDLKDFYYMAAEYMDCNVCKATFVAWDNRMLDQLTDSYRSAVLTRKYACDQSVVTLLRSCHLGNSPSSLQLKLQEIHSEEWIRKTIQYLDDCRRHKTRTNMFSSLQPTDYDEAPPFKCLPTYKWFLAVYIRDVWVGSHFFLQKLLLCLGQL